jgi:hypothetical protein
LVGFGQGVVLEVVRGGKKGYLYTLCPAFVPQYGLTKAFAPVNGKVAVITFAVYLNLLANQSQFSVPYRRERPDTEDIRRRRYSTGESQTTNIARYGTCFSKRSKG